MTKVIVTLLKEIEVEIDDNFSEIVNDPYLFPYCGQAAFSVLEEVEKHLINEDYTKVDMIINHDGDVIWEG